LINRDTRRSVAILNEKEVSDHWWGGSKTMYLVDGHWLTRSEISKQYLIVGVDAMPTAHGW
jgi:hypothetical protein